MMDGWYDGMGADGWMLMTVFWVGLIAAIVWAGARLFARPGLDSRRGSVTSPPRDGGVAQH